MIRICLLLSFIFMTFAVTAVQVVNAQDESSQEASAEKGDVSKQERIAVTPAERSGDSEEKTLMPKSMDPDVKNLNQALANLTEELDSPSRRHFYTLYNNNNLISTVKYVRAHVSQAIDACSENNPDMEQALRDRFAEWKEAVNEKMKEAEAQINNMVIAQDYAKDQDIRKILKQADDLRDKTQEGVERIPVTTKEACEYLLNKMNETQQTMVKYLNSVLVAMPQAMEQ
ncbi:MAG: hypothetical protein CMH27_01210 [Micavibrio sp.]|nr:hypothetical protein [Micavibrio sp.]